MAQIYSKLSPTRAHAHKEKTMTEEQRKFQEAWEDHIKQLASLAFQANAPTDEYERTMNTLRRWITETHTMRKES
jgi:hypothetical protein